MLRYLILSLVMFLLPFVASAETVKTYNVAGKKWYLDLDKTPTSETYTLYAEDRYAVGFISELNTETGEQESSFLIQNANIKAFRLRVNDFWKTSYNISHRKRFRGFCEKQHRKCNVNDNGNFSMVIIGSDLELFLESRRMVIRIKPEKGKNIRLKLDFVALETALEDFRDEAKGQGSRGYMIKRSSSIRQGQNR